MGELNFGGWLVDRGIRAVDVHLNNDKNFKRFQNVHPLAVRHFLLASDAARDLALDSDVSNIEQFHLENDLYAIPRKFPANLNTNNLNYDAALFLFYRKFFFRGYATDIVRLPNGKTFSSDSCKIYQKVREHAIMVMQAYKISMGESITEHNMLDQELEHMASRVVTNNGKIVYDYDTQGLGGLELNYIVSVNQSMKLPRSCRSRTNQNQNTNPNTNPNQNTNPNTNQNQNQNPNPNTNQNTTTTATRLPVQLNLRE